MGCCMNQPALTDLSSAIAGVTLTKTPGDGELCVTQGPQIRLEPSLRGAQVVAGLSSHCSLHRVDLGHHAKAVPMSPPRDPPSPPRGMVLPSLPLQGDRHPLITEASGQYSQSLSFWEEEEQLSAQNGSGQKWPGHLPSLPSHHTGTSQPKGLAGCIR